VIRFVSAASNCRSFAKPGNGDPAHLLVVRRLTYEGTRKDRATIAADARRAYELSRSPRAPRPGLRHALGGKQQMLAVAARS
jgi:hypothetical protein